MALLAACGSFEASPVDGGTDASADSARTEAGPPFCATLKGTFCEDFDDPKGGSFSGVDVPEGGTQTVVSDPHFSPPNAVRMTLRRPPAGACQYLAFYSTNLVTPAAGGFSVEFKVRPAALPAAAHVGAGVSTKSLGGNGCTFFFRVSDLNTELVVTKEDAGASSYKLDRKVLTGDWSHVELDVTGIPGSRVMTAKVDGKLGIAGVPAPAECQNDTILNAVDLGNRCIFDSVGGDLDIAFDDVRVIAH